MTKNTNRKYWLLILVGLLSFLVLLLYLKEIITEKQPSTSTEFIKNIAISFPFMVLLSLVDYRFVSFINNSIWLSKHLIIRILFESFSISLFAALFVIVGNFPFFQNLSVWDYLASMHYGDSVVAAILLNVFAVTVIEFFIQNRKNQELQQINSKMQYQQLKSQINPHFLFNSLNVLVSLINKDSERAKNYTKKLSEVYGYVLTHDLEDTVLVGEELEFIDSYVKILQIRFGEGLKFVSKINELDKRRRIPLMSLQVLIENAVKHNSITQNNPLTIHLSSDNKSLIVSNNIIPRFQIEESRGIGLENLKGKYHFISDKTIIVEQTDKEFTVKLPLL